MAGRRGGDSVAKGRTLGTLKAQLISVGSLFVISGNPLEPDSLGTVDNHGKHGGGAQDERMSVHLHHHSASGFNHNSVSHTSLGTREATNCNKNHDSYLHCAGRGKLQSIPHQTLW